MVWADIEKSVHSCIHQVAADQGISVGELTPSKRVVDDLGFSSLDVATLTALLESAFKVDPFSTGQATITEIRTLQDICDLYNRCVNGIETIGNKKSEDINDAEKARLQKRLQKRVG